MIDSDLPDDHLGQCACPAGSPPACRRSPRCRSASCRYPRATCTRPSAPGGPGWPTTAPAWSPSQTPRSFQWAGWWIAVVSGPIGPPYLPRRSPRWPSARRRESCSAHRTRAPRPGHRRPADHRRLRRRPLDPVLRRGAGDARTCTHRRGPRCRTRGRGRHGAAGGRFARAGQGLDGDRAAAGAGPPAPVATAARLRPDPDRGRGPRRTHRRRSHRRLRRHPPQRPDPRNRRQPPCWPDSALATCLPRATVCASGCISTGSWVQACSES